MQAAFADVSIPQDIELGRIGAECTLMAARKSAAPQPTFSPKFITSYTLTLASSLMTELVVVHECLFQKHQCNTTSVLCVPFWVLSPAMDNSFWSGWRGVVKRAVVKC